MVAELAILGMLVLHTAAVPCSAHPDTPSMPLDLTPFLNNKAFGTRSGEAAFDSLNQSYPAPTFDTRHFKSSDTGIVYNFPGYNGPGHFDNVICDNQVIPIEAGHYFSVSFLVAGDVESATVLGNVTLAFTDNSTSQYELRSLNWFSFLTINRGSIILPSRFTANATNYNTTHIFERTAALPWHKSLASITLPETTNTTIGRLHIFAISLWKGHEISVQDVRPTQKRTETGAQIVEVTINNAGIKCVSGQELSVSVSGPGFETSETGSIKRLCPGDQKKVHVGVEGSSKGKVTATVQIDDGLLGRTWAFQGVQVGLSDWTSDLDSLAKHESPDWFNDAKFGIFVHWGPYSVTGWGNSSPYESYAEWFWWYSNHHPQADRSDFYDYRLRTFGKYWAYDDTFPNFTASRFDAKEWVDLFEDAGAKYFVVTTKHHDGFALFDTAGTTNRSAIHYGPRRDLLRELFDAAQTYQPGLKRGTYFSLPEWFNPDFGQYGFNQFPTNTTVSWPGIPAKNPYTGVEEPYTGRVPVTDFIADLMVPQMEILAYNYSTDIMWCDCGAANGTAGFAAAWWNNAREQGREVAINSRCGIPEAADFDTPEYQTFSVAQHRKWESNQGMDPYSYGYNRATPSEAYMNASTIIYSLVDMVSKNGNFLLDIGPRADGTIVQAEMDHLREAGKWIKAHEEAIFNTTYWFIQSEIPGGPDVRFTQTDDAFYILFLEEPVISSDGIVVIEAPIPALDGDKISFLGDPSNTALSWTLSTTGTTPKLHIKVSEDLFNDEIYSWIFKLTYV
ncbi:putative tissue alpha-l-fucosidase protein [Phaeoacremonium minimum UCRPA7]|uniref:alpha-L-fucosidase n=1 Tax=Phaeoacremonium minimum (strain UCR-PA7) TaxID=1286976 RepID=R8BLB2_PHAM7|nr:putative tissue alpha-l-fucosidase protein [Phaeoacremonium minimum UCRPA7]EOO00144.1 putative tissue alpha-l-fucosidase protein [Phaeoacremonium minimum UCRPA7]